MIRVSTVLLGSVVAAVVAFNAGCQVEVSAKSKTRYVENNVGRESAEAWNGEQIEIKAEGVGASINGGLEVIADSSVTKVTATARMLAMAIPEEKPNADQSIVEAKNTYAITTSGGVTTVSCGHGGEHGSSEAGLSGCEQLTVRVPVGSASQKLSVNALSGNGSVSLKFAGATIGTITSNGKGDIDVTVPATQGGTVSIVANNADDVVAHLPSDFAADEIQLIADADSIENTFTDAKLGQGAGGRGQAGTGLALLKLASKEFAGSTGKVMLTK